METLKILIFQHELTQAEHIKVLLESSGYAVKWTNLSEEETFAVVNQNSSPCSILDVRKNGNTERKELMDIPKAIGHDGAQPRSSAPALDAKDQNNNLVRSKAQVDDFRVDGPADSSEVANTGKNARTIIQKRAPSSHGFVFEDSFFIRSNSALVKLKFEHIIYLEADANYTQLVTNEKKYIIRASLKDLEKKLDDKRFARVHKSFLVNLEKIISIQAESMQIADKEIPIGRQQYRWLTSQIRIL